MAETTKTPARRRGIMATVRLRVTQAAVFTVLFLLAFLAGHVIRGWL